MLTIRSAEVVVLGRTISYAHGGEGDRDVLLIHGYGADRSTWMFTLPALSEVARVYALDLPGHGESSLDVGSGDIPFLAGIVHGFIEKTRLIKPQLVGHSLGGAIALEIATREPERLSGLSLIAPAGMGDRTNRGFTEGFAEIANAGEAREILSLLVARPTMIGTQMVRDVLDYVGRAGVPAALRTIAAANFSEGLQHYRYDDRLASLGIPVEIIWGDRDQVLGPVRASELSVPIHLIENAGHLVHMERPREVNRILGKSIGRG